MLSFQTGSIAIDAFQDWLHKNTSIFRKLYKINTRILSLEMDSTSYHVARKYTYQKIKLR